MILYEYPLNERVRTLLRLEDLYDRVRFFLGHDSAHDHHACLTGMFEILEVASRADLKSDLLQELDRQRTILEGLRNNPAISEQKLDEVLREIERAFANLHATSGKTGQTLREIFSHAARASVSKVWLMMSKWSSSSRFSRVGRSLANLRTSSNPVPSMCRISSARTPRCSTSRPRSILSRAAFHACLNSRSARPRIASRLPRL